ncbi:hypothetical protein EDB86DRAFT_2825214 [Lactarius hatsudake]|nr:hypothetical protein EDB86DRAFT_2825214 [Lactarius hatsudake]
MPLGDQRRLCFFVLGALHSNDKTHAMSEEEKRGEKHEKEAMESAPGKSPVVMQRRRKERGTDLPLGDDLAFRREALTPKGRTPRWQCTCINLLGQAPSRHGRILLTILDNVGRYVIVGRGTMFRGGWSRHEVRSGGIRGKIREPLCDPVGARHEELGCWHNYWTGFYTEKRILLFVKAVKAQKWSRS